MNRYIIVDGKPYLYHEGKAYGVRLDEKGVTVSKEVKFPSVPAVTHSELSVRAKCKVLDTIGLDEMTLADEDQAAAETTEPEDTVETDPLDEMTLAELKEYAKAHDIDLDGATKKAAVLAAIKAAEQAVS